MYNPLMGRGTVVRGPDSEWRISKSATGPEPASLTNLWMLVWDLTCQAILSLHPHRVPSLRSFSSILIGTTSPGQSHDIIPHHLSLTLKSQKVRFGISVGTSDSFSDKTLGFLCKLASFPLCTGYSILLTAGSAPNSEAMSRARQPSQQWAS